MINLFDYFGMPEKPSIILCNPDKTELYSLGLAHSSKMTPRFNAISDFSFFYPQSIDGGQTILDAYAYLQNKRLVEVTGFDYFVITDVQTDDEGAIPIKMVSCKSLENELAVGKRIGAYGGTVKLYDPITPAGTLLYDVLLDFAPNWSVGTVDATLLTKYRTFEVSGVSVYDFLMNDVEKAFGCIFVFDTDLKTVSAKAIATATTDTDIFLSYDNLLKRTTFSEKSDELVSCLSVYGGNDLDILNVNPMGTNKIYNFDYYATSSWMSAGLISAVAAWKALFTSKQVEYAGWLTLLIDAATNLIVLDADLVDLQGEWNALDGVRKVKIEQGLDLASTNVLLAAKQVEIDNKNIEITNQEASIVTINAELTTINTEVSFATNFTPAQLIELNDYIYENTYQNENIIQTDSMTTVEIQAASQDLYDDAVVILTKLAQPRYEFSMEAVNFMVLPDFSTFTDSLELGCNVTIETATSTYVTSVLLELSFTFDDPTDFTMTFSNRLRLDNGNFVYSDLMGMAQKTSSEVNFNNLKWGNWSNTYKDDVTTFITSALDATVNNLINNSNQEILINQNGLKGRSYDSITGTFDPTQVWLTSSVLAFTDDNWATSKLALGEVTVGTTTSFGLVGDVIVGHIIAGNQLTISNENNNFLLDASGAFLNNATLTISKTGENSKIFLDPDNGIKIQANVGGTWTDRFYVDNTGNVNFSGNLSGATGSFTGSIDAASGRIGGWYILSDGLYAPFGDYIKSDRHIKLGALSIDGATAIFDGTIYADKLVGQLVTDQLTDGIIVPSKVSYLSADSITTGYLSGNRIYGGTLNWPGGSISGGSTTVIYASGYVQLNGGGSVMTLQNGTLTCAFGGGNINLIAGVTSISGDLSVSGGTGKNKYVSYIKSGGGTGTLTFNRGILVSYT